MADRSLVEVELQRVDEIKRSGESADFFAPFDPGHLTERLQAAIHLSVEEFVLIGRFLGSCQSLRTRFASGRLKDFFTGLHDHASVCSAIERVIDETGAIRDDASPELARIRKKKRQIDRRLRELLKSMLEQDPAMYTDLNIVERSGHFVLPVRSNLKKQVKGIVHSFSNSGETVFIEPMAVAEDAARIVQLEEEERGEIESILRSLTKVVAVNCGAIEDDLERIIDLDLLFAKVRHANELGANRPVFDHNLALRDAFHPVLKQINENIVPLSFHLNSGKRILLISGPNAGGKTVVLKTVGLVSLMAKCGLFIPAGEGSTVPFFKEIYADIGDEQSIESQLSTFAAHIKQIRAALEGSTDSLILLDELMSQTSVEEGSALASAILDELSKGERVVLATTHNENLKILASNREDMVNAGMEYTDRPTYRLILGVPQPSNAIRLARSLGISEAVLEKASSHLDEDKMSVNKLFEDLSQELKTVEEERKRLSAAASEYEEKLAAFNARKKHELEELRSRYRGELARTKRDVERLIKTLRKEGPKPELVHKTRDFFESKVDEREQHVPYHPGVGELVRIRELKRIGQVVAEKQGRYKISLQNIFYWVEPTDIESIRENGGTGR